MKKLLERKNMPWIVLGLGVLGYLLRTGLYAAAVDEKGLLLRGHPLEWALWLLAALTGVLVPVFVQKLDGSNKYEHNFGPSGIGAWFTGLFALLGVGGTVLLEGPGMTRLELAGFACGVLAAGTLIRAAVLRRRGSKPSFLPYCILCVYLALYMINHYRLWSGDPQLMDYVFQLFAVIFLTLFAYQQSAFCLGLGDRRTLLTAGLLGTFACAVSMSGSLLSAMGLLWCLTNLCSLEPVPPEPEEPAEEESL